MSNYTKAFNAFLACMENAVAANHPGLMPIWEQNTARQFDSLPKRGNIFNTAATPTTILTLAWEREFIATHPLAYALPVAKRIFREVAKANGLVSPETLDKIMVHQHAEAGIDPKLSKAVLHELDNHLVRQMEAFLPQIDQEIPAEITSYLNPETFTSHHERQ